MTQLMLPGFLPTYPVLSRTGWFFWYPYATSWIGVDALCDCSDLITRKVQLVIIPIVVLN